MERVAKHEPLVTKEASRDRNRRIFRYAWMEKRWLLLSIGILAVTAALELIGPYIISRVLDRELVEGVGVRSVPVFAGLLAAYGIVTLIGAVALYFSDVLAQKAANRITAHIRDDVFQHIQRMPLAYFDSLPAGKVVSRVTNDTKALQTLYQMVLSDVLMAFVIIIATYVTLLTLAWQVALMLLIPIMILILLIRDYRKKSAVYSADYRRTLSEVSAEFNENLQNMDLLQAFHRKAWAETRFEDANQRLFDVGKKFVILDAYSSYNAVAVLRYFTVGLILAVFGIATLHGVKLFSVGLLFLFIDYTTKIFNRGQNLSQRLSDMERAKAAGDHIFELLRMPEEPDAAADGMKDPEPLDILEGDGPLIAFDHVSFAYKEGVPVLEDISFSVERGQTVAFVGATGSGKSTIMNLVQRFYDPQQGEIRMAGHPLTEHNRETIRRPMAIVQQDPTLFTGTVYDNISLGREAITEADALEALEEVGGAFFLARHPKGLQTKVRQNGEDFSSGERQLISFARALAQDPTILVLDEATAHVDSETEQLIQRGITRLQQDRTTLIIAHRLSTIRHADQILILDDGRIIERGTHDELLALDGMYAAMHAEQMGDDGTDEA